MATIRPRPTHTSDGGDGHHREREHLAVELAVQAREADEGEVRPR